MHIFKCLKSSTFTTSLCLEWVFLSQLWFYLLDSADGLSALISCLSQTSEPSASEKSEKSMLPLRGWDILRGNRHLTLVSTVLSQLREISAGISLASVKLIWIRDTVSNLSPCKFIKSWMKETKFKLTFRGWNRKMPLCFKLEFSRSWGLWIYELIVDFCTLYCL